MNWTFLLATACGIAVTQGLFLSILLIRRDKIQFSENFYLALVVLGISLRVGKSLVYYFWNDMSLIGVAIGGAGLWMIGPAILGYLKSKDEIKVGRYFFMHFMPATILLFVGAFLSWDIFAWVYLLGIIHVFAYLAAGIFFSAKRRKINYGYSTLVLIGVGLINGAFLFQFITDTIELYAIGALIAAFVLYVLNFRIANQLQAKKSLSSNPVKSISSALLTEVKTAIDNALLDDQVYKESNLTLSKLAERVNQPVYIVRQAIIATENKNFNDYVNSYRVNEVKKMLEEEYCQYTIEGMAYEVGFKSPSSFYEAFRKSTNCTPNQYRKKYQMV